MRREVWTKDYRIVWSMFNGVGRKSKRDDIKQLLSAAWNTPQIR